MESIGSSWLFKALLHSTLVGILSQREMWEIIADLRPQGTVMRSEIVEVGPIPNHLHHQDDSRWSAFHITTCHGLRLECSSLLKVQVVSCLV